MLIAVGLSQGEKISSGSKSETAIGVYSTNPHSVKGCLKTQVFKINNYAGHIRQVPTSFTQKRKIMYVSQSVKRWPRADLHIKYLDRSENTEP